MSITTDEYRSRIERRNQPPEPGGLPLMATDGIKVKSPSGATNRPECLASEEEERQWRVVNS